MHVPRTQRLTVVFLILSLVLCGFARAKEIYSDEEGEKKAELNLTTKGSSLLSYNPDDPFLYPVRRSALGLLRARTGLRIRHSDKLNSEFAYEHNARAVSNGASVSAGGTILPSFAEAPWRVEQLEWQVMDTTSNFAWRHEIDRALMAYHPSWGEVTVGRQAIGLGRGVIFSAVDVFAPFSPLEVDREWRRGVDAARCEYRLSPTTSAEVMGVFGDTWDDSAVLARVRGYLGDLDGELIVGKHAEDAMIGAVMSTIVKGAEVHAELAGFDTRSDQAGGGFFGHDEGALKGVLGSSYTFDVGRGLTLLGEYHYSGFGVREAEDAVVRLADPDFQERFLRGDTQILGRHALAAQLSYPFNSEWSGTLLFLGSPTDGSGVASPGVRWDVSDTTSVTASGFLPWGEDPSNGRLKSQYGGQPASLFLQVSLYF
jgi:hypothetical protein